jgi:Ca-activated chloride channel family protein
MKRHRTSTSGFGLTAWLEQTQIHLPLKAIECRFEASGAAVNVQIDQVFHQSAGRPLDVTYSFPLPSKAAAYRCEMIVNGRTIRAKVVEQEAARRIVSQKKAEGRRTALVEMERGNLFTLSLGNVQPDDIIVIRFAYIEELDAWKDELALQIPFNPGVRYIPGEPLLRLNSGRGAADDTDQVPDASRLSPPRIDRMNPDAARISLSGRLDGCDVDPCSISSPTHPPAVRPADGSFEIFLPVNAAVPDRDFVLRWRRASRPGLQSIAWVSSDGEETYALIQLSAPDDVPTDREGNDLYFLVDRSASMAGEKWAKTADALIAFVKATAQHDRVWITFFESGYRDFAEKPLGRDALLRDANFQSLVKLGTGGGTELLPALRHVLGAHRRFSARRRSHIILITDGQVANEEAVLKEVSGKTLPVHCFGIDHAVNEAFLRQLSGQQRGTSVLLTPNDDLVRPVAILGSRLSRPVFTDLTLEAGWELAGTELPDIYAGQTVFAPIRTNGNRSDLKIAGKNSVGRPLTVQLHAQAAKTDLPKLIWMKHRIESLLQGGKTREAIALAEKANLVCRGTAFVAWADAEEVAIAQREVYQPSLEVPALLRSRRLPAPMSRHVSFSISAPAFLESEPKESWYDAGFCPDIESVIDLLDPQRLTEQLNKVIESVYRPDDAKKLTSIVLDWAKHVGDKQVKDTLSVLLCKCEHDGEARFLREVLSDFFLALHDPWQKKASSILSAITAQTGGRAVSNMSNAGETEPLLDRTEFDGIAILPKSVRYVKNGQSGKWWPTAKAHGQIHCGWSDIPNDILRTGKMAEIEKVIRAEFGTKPGATRNINALRALLDRPSQHIWVTFQEGCIWWCTVKDEIEINSCGQTKECGHFWLTCDRPWNNHSVNGRHLAKENLPGIVTTLAVFPGATCKPKGWKEILRIIRDEVDLDAAATARARKAYQVARPKLIGKLSP